jgi:hypothetical protein
VSSAQQFIDSLLRLLIQFGNLVMGFILTIELWLRSQLNQFGVSHNIQTVILLAVALLLIVSALRLFGGLIRVALILFLLLLLIDLLLPVVQH